MNSPSPHERVSSRLVSVFLLMLSATLAWGVVLDYQSRGTITEGVTIAGEDLSGGPRHRRASQSSARSSP